MGLTFQNADKVLVIICNLCDENNEPAPNAATMFEAMLRRNQISCGRIDASDMWNGHFIPKWPNQIVCFENIFLPCVALAGRFCPKCSGCHQPVKRRVVQVGRAPRLDLNCPRQILEAAGRLLCFTARYAKWCNIKQQSLQAICVQHGRRCFLDAEKQHWFLGFTFIIQTG